MRILFFGTPDFSVPTLRGLLEIPGASVCAVLTQPDKPAGRGSEIRMSPVKKLALEHGIPVLQPRSLRKDPDILRQIEALGPFDIGVVIAFGQILPQKILDLPLAGCVNIHASLLPRWRGAAPIHRAILAGDKETGVCLMQMEAGLDTGAVYRRRSIPIGPTDTTGVLHDVLAQMGADLLKEAIHSICAGTERPEPQPENGVTYAQKVDVSEARIDWTNPADEIDRTIRGFSPYPGAFTSLNGKRLKILSGTILPSRPGDSPKSPGAASFVGRDRLEIACGSGEILVQEVQLEGKKRMSIGDFLRGIVIVEGTTFN